MPVFSDNKYNPNPITKIIITFILGLTLLYEINIYFEFAVVIIFSFFFYKNGLKKDAIKSVVFFVLLSIFPKVTKIENIHMGLKMFFMIFLVCRMFYLPFLSGKFMIKTSDVGSIVSSMDKIKLPKEISIPIAIIFRFFPSFKEEKRNIKLAMKIRGIDFRNPIAYFEYVTVPLLIISSNISDDIARAAETRCIENPIKKTRYISVKIKLIDYIFIFLILAMTIGGLIW